MVVSLVLQLGECVLRAALFQHGDCGQGFAFYKFEESTTTGGYIGNLLTYAVLVNRCDGIAAAGEGERGAVGDGVGQYFGAVFKLVEFEYANRPVPQYGLCVLS